MVVNEALAERAFPGQDPIGRRMACCEPDSTGGPAWKEIIGVVGDVRSAGLASEVETEFYLPIEQAPADAWNWLQRTMTIAVRTAGDPAAATPILADAVRAVDPSLPVFQVATMDQRIGRSLAESRFNTQLLTVLGVLGLCLAVVGIYGVIAYCVARRTREIGIRSALGATRGSIRALVVREGLGPALVGVALGTIASLGLTRFLAGQLRGVSPVDPVTIGVVALCLLVVAAGATLIPAAAATRIDVTVAMREE
jgi:predicted lysophospholipase L1 biosynthesis ABC-type transport system permease subunit